MRCRANDDPDPYRHMASQSQNGHQVIIKRDDDLKSKADTVVLDIETWSFL